jgi:hypothetical protein
MGYRTTCLAAVACVLLLGLAGEASATIGKVPGEGVTCPGNGIWGEEPAGLVASHTFLGTTELEYGPCHTSAAAQGHVAFSKDGLSMKLSAAPGATSSEAVGFWGATGTVSGVSQICISENVRDAKGRVDQFWRIFVNGSLASGGGHSLVAGPLTECLAVEGAENVRWVTFISAEAGRHLTKSPSADVTLTGVSAG